jgi:membrane protease YdiL (CAAX protease family)
MAPIIHNPFIKVLLPVLAILAVWLLSKYRHHISLKQDLKIRRPAFNQLVLWLAVYIIWMLTTNYFMDWRGPWDFSPWQQQPLYVSIMRVLAVGILGPIAEELIFRGLIFYRLNKLNLTNKWILMALIAVFWAAIHIDYSWQVRAVIFVDGILLGVAMLKSNSLVTPILMHVAWNLYAIW